MKTALTIAGSDPTAGAGLQADLKVFRSFNIHGLSVLAAITAQNTKGVESVYPVEPTVLKQQLQTVLSDMMPDAIKTGMLFTKNAVEIISETLAIHPCRNLVVDPVSVSSSGMSLVENGTLDILRDRLFRLSRIVTPNIYEASLLTGIAISDQKGMENAAISLKRMGPEAVVVTGGHLENKAIDCYYDGKFHFFDTIKQEGEYHGTGCAFSSAIAALLALGNSSIESVKGAKEFVSQAIRKAYFPGTGMGILLL
jgi:hydroxymethylpyrimidine/phosphomethylpyrimidine kinase